MADEEKSSEAGQKGSTEGDFWPDWLKPRRMWEFARNIVQLETFG